jgi:hypothetical protein
MIKNDTIPVTGVHRDSNLMWRGSSPRTGAKLEISYVIEQ